MMGSISTQVITSYYFIYPSRIRKEHINGEITEILTGYFLTRLRCPRVRVAITYSSGVRLPDGVPRRLRAHQFIHLIQLVSNRTFHLIYISAPPRALIRGLRVFIR